MEGRVDYYAVLAVEPTATKSEIQKAYRKLALKWHPDRNPDDPVAADKFLEIFRAYEFLSNDETRAKYDGELRAKMLQRQRMAEMDEKHRKMREALEAREAAARKVRSAEGDERERLKREIERLREENKAKLQRMEQDRARSRASEHAASAVAAAAASAPLPRRRTPPPPPPPPPPPLADVSAAHGVRLRWDGGTLPPEVLRAVLAPFGALESVVSRRPGTALAVFRTERAARDAVDAGSVRVSQTVVSILPAVGGAAAGAASSDRAARSSPAPTGTSDTAGPPRPGAASVTLPAASSAGTAGKSAFPAFAFPSFASAPAIAAGAAASFPAFASFAASVAAAASASVAGRDVPSADADALSYEQAVLDRLRQTQARKRSADEIADEQT